MRYFRGTLQACQAQRHWRCGKGGSTDHCRQPRQSKCCDAIVQIGLRGTCDKQAETAVLADQVKGNSASLRRAFGGCMPRIVRGLVARPSGESHSGGMKRFAEIVFFTVAGLLVGFRGTAYLREVEALQDAMPAEGRLVATEMGQIVVLEEGAAGWRGDPFRASHGGVVGPMGAGFASDRRGRLSRDCV